MNETHLIRLPSHIRPAQWLNVNEQVTSNQDWAKTPEFKNRCSDFQMLACLLPAHTTCCYNSSGENIVGKTLPS